MSDDYETLLASVSKRCEAVGQSHILKYVKPDGDASLSEEDKLAFLQSVAEIPLEKLSSFLAGALAEEQSLQNIDASNPANDIRPFGGESASTAATDAETVAELEASRQSGLDAVGRGEVAALLLAGGQGTRLGYDGPKGMYDIGLTSKRTLFRLMSERVKKLGGLCGKTDKQVPLYVMTSPLNHAATTAYFTDNDNFGIDVVFFPQGTLPAMTPDGKMILETPTKLVVAPDGNGGIYPAMVRHGILDDMKKRGIKYVHAFGVDNALVKPADPLFVGYCLRKGADCGNKVLWKTAPNEKVGVVAEKDGKPCVVEYSDISQEMSERRDGDGRLIFGAGNICNHFYTLEFLSDVVVPNLGNMFHVARKKIPHWNEGEGKTIKPTSNNGFKLESFIFDVFSLSTSMTVLDVRREDEFAPVKNPPGSDSDSPDTARALFSGVAKKWATDAGAKLEGDLESDACEVAPETSYNGEGLEHLNGTNLRCPFSI